MLSFNNSKIDYPGTIVSMYILMMLEFSCFKGQNLNIYFTFDC